MRKTLIGLTMLAAAAVGSLPAMAAEPSLHEVYQAADAGKLDEAQRMMHEVLQAHPNSAKAHFVEAELLARQGQLKKAESELSTAEKLAPGLPFAKPQAVSHLKELLGGHRQPQTLPAQHAAAVPAAPAQSFPWGLILLGLAAIAFIVWATRLMTRRNAQPAGQADYQTAGNGFGYRPAAPAAPVAPYGGGSATAQPYNAGGFGNTPAPAAGEGMGSRIMGGLATGAAVGAGIVAGQALMHHFTDDHKEAPRDDAQRFSSFDDIPSLPDSGTSDMGGNDFGIADSGSWDDAGGDDSDWT